MQFNLALLAAMAAVVLSVGLNILQGQESERLRIDITAKQEKLEGSVTDLREGLEKRFAAFGARLDELPPSIPLEDFDTELGALRNDLTAKQEKLEGSVTDLREGLEKGFAAFGARLDELPPSIPLEDFDTELGTLRNDLTAKQEKLEGSVTDLREGLEKRFAAFGARLDELPPSIPLEDFDTELGALRNDLTAKQEKLEGSVTDLREGLEKRFAAFGVRLDELPPSIPLEDFDTELGTLRNDLTAKQEKLEGSVTDLREGLEKRFAAFGARLDELPPSIPLEDFDTELGTLRNDLTAKQEKLEGSVTDLREGLEKRFAAFGARLDELPPSIPLEDFDTELGTLRNDLTAKQEKLEGSVTDLREGLEKRFAAFGARLDELPPSIPLEDFDTELGTLRNDLTAKQEKLEGSVTDLREGLEKRFAAFGARLDELPPSIPLEDFNTELGALRNDLTAKQEKLEGSVTDLREGLEKRFAAFGARLDWPDGSPDSSPSPEDGLSVDDLQKIGDVYFENGKFRLTSSEQERLKRLVADFDGSEFVLIGSADSVGDEFYNATLSLLRATSVQRELEALLDGTIKFVSIDGVGELGAPVKTLDGTAEKQNRRVRIFSTNRAPSEGLSKKPR